MRRPFAILMIVALLGGALLQWPTEVGGVINYDAALAVQRGVAMATAAALHLSMAWVALAAFIWYGGWIGVMAFESRAQTWRHEVFGDLKQRLQVSRVGRVRRRRRHPPKDQAEPTRREAVVRWTERQHWSLQLLVLLLCAMSINGVWICVAIMDGWRSERVRWPAKAAMLGVTNTAGCLIWQLVLGGQMQTASAFKQVLITGCQLGMYAVIAAVVAWQLRALAIEIARTWSGNRHRWSRPAWSRARA